MREGLAIEGAGRLLITFFIYTQVSERERKRESGRVSKRERKREGDTEKVRETDRERQKDRDTVRQREREGSRGQLYTLKS